MDAKPAKRRRFRYSLRGLMLLILVLGVGLGVWGEKARRQRLAVAAIVAYGGQVAYDYEMVNGHYQPDRHPSEPKWLLRLSGIDYFHNVKSVVLIRPFLGSDEVVSSSPNRTPHPLFAKLADLPGLRKLHLNGTTDAEIGRLRGLTGLEELYIDMAPRLSDAGLQPLSNLEKLKILSLIGRFTDKGLYHLSGLRNLEQLYLTCENYLDGSKSKPITDEGLKYLRGMTKLRRLVIDLDPVTLPLIDKASITDDGLAEIAKLDSLEMLSLGYGRFSNRGAVALRGMKKLKYLWLDSGPYTIDDTGIKDIAAIENLEELKLSESQITDRSLELLAKDFRIKSLALNKNDKLTPAGFDRLKAARPDLKVSH